MPGIVRQYFTKPMKRDELKQGSKDRERETLTKIFEIKEMFIMNYKLCEYDAVLVFLRWKKFVYTYSKCWSRFLVAEKKHRTPGFFTHLNKVSTQMHRVSYLIIMKIQNLLIMYCRCRQALFIHSIPYSGYVSTYLVFNFSALHHYHRWQPTYYFIHIHTNAQIWWKFREKKKNFTNCYSFFWLLQIMLNILNWNAVVSHQCCGCISRASAAQEKDES